MKPLASEVNIDETIDIIESIINELVEPKATYFRMYEEAKTKILLGFRFLKFRGIF